MRRGEDSTCKGVRGYIRRGEGRYMHELRGVGTCTRGEASYMYEG